MVRETKFPDRQDVLGILEAPTLSSETRVGHLECLSKPKGLLARGYVAMKPSGIRSMVLMFVWFVVSPGRVAMKLSIWDSKHVLMFM